MVYNTADKDLIKTLFLEKGWRGARIVREFPGKNWTRNAVTRIIKRLEDSGTVERQEGSGRPVTVCTAENREYVEDHDGVIACTPGLKSKPSQAMLPGKKNSAVS